MSKIKLTVNTKMSLRKHSISIFVAESDNFAKHNEAHKNLAHAYKKTCISLNYDPHFMAFMIQSAKECSIPSFS